MKSRYGSHCSELDDALTLFETGGRLSAIGHELGCEVFCEFPPAFRERRGHSQKIDFVWAVRGDADRSPQRRWHVVAAFECEGLDVARKRYVQSLKNDVDRLTDVAEGTDIVKAVVLYRTSEDGSLFWRQETKSKTKKKTKEKEKALATQQQEWIELAERRLGEFCEHQGCPPIPVLLDNELLGDGSPAFQALRERVRVAVRGLESK